MGVTMPSANNTLFPRESSMPVTVLMEDLSKAVVPLDYFRSLIGNRSIKDMKVCDLPKSLVSSEIQKQLQYIVNAEVAPRSLFITNESDFSGSATEFLLCGIGTVFYATPATIALAQIKNTLRGTPSIIEYAEESDYIFIADAVSGHQQQFFKSEPAAAAHFYEFLSIAKHSLHGRIIFGAWRFPTKKPDMPTVRKHLEAIYTDSTVDLILYDTVIA
jgi:hypothetical protein